MQIIKNKAIIENTWQYVADEQALPASGDVTVSMARWLQEHSSLPQHNGQVGVRLQPQDSVHDIAADLGKLVLIELNFALYTAGQGFSQARQLRGQYQYQGELRAVGEFMVDQVYYLSRVGVNAFALPSSKEIPLALESLNDFSSSYQTVS